MKLTLAYMEEYEKHLGCVDLNLFEIEPRAREKVKVAMFADLTMSLSDARKMKEIHPKWESQRL